jgi:hypothetical protein
MRGANIVMPNLTPPQYRVMYEICPDKVFINEMSEACPSCLSMRIMNIGNRRQQRAASKAEGQNAVLNIAKNSLFISFSTKKVSTEIPDPHADCLSSYQFTVCFTIPKIVPPTFSSLKLLSTGSPLY